MSQKLMDYFNKQPRIGMLSTSGKDGKVDTAIFGSPRMTDEKTVFMGIGKNRSLSYLQQNPYAVYMIIEPGKSLMDWKGIRVYLKMKDIATSGTILDTYKRQIANAVGEAAAAMIYAGVSFEVIEVRPIVDMGQGWEKSV
jgi:Pyridoxamine 5'-phosphate oxidase